MTDIETEAPVTSTAPPAKRGVIVEIQEVDGKPQFALQPMGIDPLAIPSFLKLAAKAAEQNLGI
jgi:hypothetical protein